MESTPHHTVPPATIRVEWRPRASALEPAAVAAWGSAGRALGRRLLARDDLKELAGVVAEDLIVVLGPGHALPWADGVLYLGAEPAAPSLLIPTLLAPSVPTDVLWRAFVRRFGGGPIAVLPERGLAVPLGGAREIAADLLAAWVEGNTGRIGSAR